MGDAVATEEDRGMRRGIDGKTDLEDLDDIVRPSAMPLEKCKAKFRTSVRRSHGREYINVTRGPVTLPKLKFLDGDES